MLLLCVALSHWLNRKIYSRSEARCFFEYKKMKIHLKYDILKNPTEQMFFILSCIWWVLFLFFLFISFFYEWWNVSCSGRFFPFKAALGGATPSSQGVGSIYKELWKTASLWPNRFHLPALLTEEGCCTWLGSDGTPAHNSYTSDSERSGEARTDQDASTSCWHSRDLFLVRVFSFCRVLYRW